MARKGMLKASNQLRRKAMLNDVRPGTIGPSNCKPPLRRPILKVPWYAFISPGRVFTSTTEDNLPPNLEGKPLL